MRLVRFEEELERRTVELHPRLTVLTGVDPAVRVQLVRAFRAISQGRDPHLRGVVEAHSVLLELTADTLSLFELGQADDDLDAVMTSGDLPATPPDRHSGASTAADASADVEATEALLADARDRAESLRERVAESERRHAGVAGTIDELSRSFDPEAVSALNAARQALAAAEAERAATPPTAAEPAADHLEWRHQLDVARVEVERLARIDVGAVAAANGILGRLLTQSERSSAVETVSARVAELARRRRELEQVMAHNRLHDLTDARDRARADFERAERDVRSPVLPDTTVDELESTHDQAWDLDGKVGGLGGGFQRRKLAELRVREERLLAQLGFDTWADYVMGVLNPSATAEREEVLAAARAEYERAEQALADAAIARPDVSRELASLTAEEAAAKRELARLLGVEPSVPVGAPVGVDDVVAQARRVLGALASAGADPGIELEPQQVFDLAQSWLAAMEGLPARLATAEARAAELAERLATLDETPAIPPKPNRGDAVERAREAMEKAEDHAHQQRELRAQLEEQRALLQQADLERSSLEGDLALARRTVDERREELDAAKARLQEAIESAERLSASRSRAVGEGEVQAIEWYVLARLAHQRGVSYAGSLPMLIDDPFAGWSPDDLPEVFERLSRMSDVVQLVYLTDDVAVVEWAQRLGEDVASVVDLGLVAHGSGW